MLKSILCVLLVFINGGIMRFEKLIDCFDYAKEMSITINGKEVLLEKGNDKFELVLNALKEITKHSNEMPAFGVSIDSLTREDMKNGVWLELCFDGQYSYQAMGFESLLIKVDKDWHGFNLIRKKNLKYDGRCFYLSLENSMNKLYETLLNLNP